MINRSVSCFCETAGKAAAQAICATFGDGGPGGAGCFSVPLSTQQGVTDRSFATHWGMSGDIPEDEVHALEVSLDPKCWVFELNPQGSAPQTFDDHLAMCVPPLYRVIEGL